jgi:AraC-like DNA-binding protein
MKHSQTIFRYLPVSEESRAWGAYMPDAGFAMIPPGSSYPPCPHPDDHHFTWEKGRILHAYQFLYITRGSGCFESEPSGTVDIKAGDLFIVFPETWHRYHPDPNLGWDEYWVEFDGDYIRRLMTNPVFTPSQPVLHLGLHQSLLQLFMEAVEGLSRQPAEYPYLLGALAVQIIARTLSLNKQKSFEGKPVEQMVREAKQWLARQGGKPIPLQQFAAQFNMSYSAFRRLFKVQTGYAPRQFALEVSVRRAKELLTQTTMPVQQIAEELGFESVHYFSRLLKQKTGFGPRALRQQGSGSLRTSESERSLAAEMVGNQGRI